MARGVQRCDRCRRRLRSVQGWNAVMEKGSIVCLLCPRCQTPEESVEAEVNEATLHYGLRSDGRVVGRPKVSGAQP